MENKINIAELLKNCPKGMELNCMTYQDVYFDYVDELNIIHCYIQHETHKTSITFNQFGTPNRDIKSKCVIFPKGKFTWAGFYRPFMDGDVIYNKDINAIAIFYKQTDASTISHCFLNVFRELKFYHYHAKDLSDWKFATEEEKEKLFQAIKDNGYKWDPKTNTLNKLPIFKIGDRIKHIVGREEIATVVGVEKFHYNVDSKVGTTSFSISLQHEWELVPNKFDIADLKPFETVLVRNSNKGRWVGQFYLSYNFKEEYPFECTYNCWKYCIPYKGNEHLLNKTDEPDNFYITWKE